MGMNYVLRWGEPSDHATLADIMFDAVRNGPSQYSEQQRAAWVPIRRDGQAWNDRLATQNIIVGERDGRAMGFMTLAHGGYVDFAYIRPSARRTGLFRQMFERLEEQARLKGVSLLWVHASLAAQPAFATVGFEIRKYEEVALGSERLARFEMEKKLSV